MKRRSAMASKVYFTREITPYKVVELYRLLGIKLPGKVAVKLHSGEAGNQNFLKPEFWRPIIEEVGGTAVECNTCYDGARGTNEAHWKTIEAHGWKRYFDFDLMDEESPDLELPVSDGKHLKVNYVGSHMANYDSLLVLSHFKGHPMGGFGGALKQLSIGFASRYGKAWIHTSGHPENLWTDNSSQIEFLESMADAAGTVAKFFAGKAVYINVMKNLSVDCDCCAVAEDPCMKDIGILISDDPVAIDQACIDLIYAAKDDPGQKHFIERVESRHGVHTIESADGRGFGTREYELITID